MFHSITHSPTPKYDESLVQQHNQMIDDWLNEHIEQIAKGKIKVFVEDECHLKAGDICPKGYRFAYGYGWGDRQERLETPVKNYRDSQTYYGAMNCLTGEMILRSYSECQHFVYD